MKMPGVSWTDLDDGGVEELLPAPRPHCESCAHTTRASLRSRRWSSQARVGRAGARHCRHASRLCRQAQRMA